MIDDVGYGVRRVNNTVETVVGSPSDRPAVLPGAVRAPYPELMTENEAIHYLRLDTIKGLKNPRETLARYRAQGILKGTQVSKSVFYRRIELDRFLDRLTSENPR